MDVTKLKDLELQVEQLIVTIQQLESENASLKRRLHSAVQDRSSLQERHQNASAQIKKIISQLKEELS